MKIATNIQTSLWSNMIKTLVTEGWIMTNKYQNFDEGIDFDFLILNKDNNHIMFGWDNYTEGEIKCTNELMDMLSAKFNLTFQYGEPQNLKPSIIALMKVKNLSI
jgi:hypothetical protein